MSKLHITLATTLILRILSLYVLYEGLISSNRIDLNTLNQSLMHATVSSIKA